MDKFLTSFGGGEPYKLDDIRFNDDSYRDAFNNLLLAWGTNFIVSGCDVAGGAVSAGYIMLNGELLKVDSHIIQGAGFFQKQSTFDPNGLKNFKNGNINNTYQKNRGIAIANSGTLSVNGIRLTELISINNITTNVINNITGTTVNKIPVIGSNLSGNTFLMTDGNKKIISTKTSIIDTEVSNMFSGLDTFSLIPDQGNISITASLVNYLKIGKIVFIEVIVTIVVNSSTGNLIQLKENGITHADLMSRSSIMSGARVFSTSVAPQSGLAYVLDPSLGADRFIVRFIRYDNSNFGVGTWNLAFQAAYRSV